jgi:2-deoxy-D-gluconate 3-dehydrogenase
MTSWLPTQRLEGERALVMGAGRGIGRACALAIAEAGAHVTLFSRSREELEAVAREIGEADLCTGDVRHPEDVERAVGQADPTLLVNAAGLNRPGPTVDKPLADWDLILDTNLRGTFLACQAAGRRMVERGHGRIVNISSQMGSVALPGRAAYCASKHAVDGLVRALAVEWAPLGIAVNAVAPTFVETPLTRPMLDDRAFREDVLRRVPVGRVGQVEEVVGAIVFLASDQASLVTGHVLAVDGGWTAW